MKILFVFIFCLSGLKLMELNDLTTAFIEENEYDLKEILNNINESIASLTNEDEKNIY